MDLTRAGWRKSTRSGSNGGACVEVATWRKSSRSGHNGGDCVEVATWRKSTRSGDNGGACVEVAQDLPHAVAVRDSKNPAGPRLVVAPAAWQAFTGLVKSGKHNLT
jgi:Domain of unknown function (DUF397)